MLVEKCWQTTLAIWMIYISNLSILMIRGITEDKIMTCRWQLNFCFLIFFLIFHKGHSNCFRPHLLNLVLLWKHQWVSKNEEQKANHTVRTYSHCPKRKTSQSSLVPPSLVPDQGLSLLVETRRDSIFIFHDELIKEQIHYTHTAVPLRSHHRSPKKS